MNFDCDALVIGAGPAGTASAILLAQAGWRVIIVEQEGEQNLGGQAFVFVGQFEHHVQIAGRFHKLAERLDDAR